MGDSVPQFGVGTLGHSFFIASLRSGLRFIALNQCQKLSNSRKYSRNGRKKAENVSEMGRFGDITEKRCNIVDARDGFRG